MTEQRESDAPAAKSATKKPATKKPVAKKPAVAGGAPGAAVVAPAVPIKRDPRRMYLAGLMQKILSHADFMRQFLEGQDQNTTLGLAAETGLRDVLRAVLPSSFGVTSGFMCQADGRLVEPVVEGEISPQTDVILYNASHACPFYRMNDIEVLAARDALGFVEVKDRVDGEYALRDMGKDKPGALPHVARLVAHCARRISCRRTPSE